MEKKANQLKTIAIALASITALSVFFFARSRRHRNHNCPQSCCYLQGDHRKPQYGFKRVPADNSYSPFKHLSLKDSNDDKSWNSHPCEVEIGDLVESLKLELEWIAIEKNADLKMGESYVWVETESELSH